jgi:hypothetical protein
MGDPDHVRAVGHAQADVCAGWATGTPLLESMRRDGVNLVPIGPPAPEIDHGWHEIAPLAEGTVRRRRQLDAARSGDAIVVNAYFRDSHAGADGETVMHEYIVAARFDAAARLAAVDVEARTLPWRECPGAVASAQLMVGVSLAELTERVRADLVGPTTCTHLTSTMRCLADVAALVPMLPSP